MSDSTSFTRKPKLSPESLVYDKMKKEKGIKFTIKNEEEAVEYLKNKNNYYRLASYRKNYDKHKTGINEGKYINLEFAYLTELSTIDMHLRFQILKMCLDIEHQIKMILLSDMENDEAEDGYTVVKRFLSMNSWVCQNIYKKRYSVYVGDIISKYFVLDDDKKEVVIEKSDCPAWAFLEVITFGELIEFYKLYYDGFKVLGNSLNSIKSLRNACAHNNCIINNLRKGATRPPAMISKFISGIPGISKEERKNKLSIRPIYEIVCLLYAYERIVSEKIKAKRYEELSELVNVRMIRNKEYFFDQQIIRASYNFLKKLVDFLT